MAKIIPFKGILYNPNKIHDMADVTAPPYDVISVEEQEYLHDRHPNNVVRLILGKTSETDTRENNRYTRAASCFNKWLSEDILSQDKSPAFYLTAVEFSLGNKRIIRYGLIALVGLEPFEKGIILPHEKTFSKVKSERLELMKVCKANFSQIFSLYSDQSGILNSLKDAVADTQPDLDFVDDKGEAHKLWRITDAAVHQHISDAMKEKRLFIADGHHRYETALNYRDWVAKNNPDFNADHPANYIMMYLCSMEDPGLIVFSTHRMISKVPDSARDTFIRKAEDYFDIKRIPFKGNERETAGAGFMAELGSDTSRTRIGVLIKEHSEFYLLTIKPKVMEQMFGDELSKSLRTLDVTVLTRLILIKILDFDQSSLDNEKLIEYSSSEKKVIDAVLSGKCDIAFILNPTKIEQVRNIAEEGLTMPRKTTYFYPKAITGQVLNKLTP